MLGIKVDVKVVEPKTITRSEGKAVRVIDKRDLYKQYLLNCIFDFVTESDFKKCKNVNGRFI